MVREGRRAAEVHLARRGGVAGVPARGRDFGQGKTGHSRLHKRAVAEPGEDSERGRSPRDMFIYDVRKQHSTFETRLSPLLSNLVHHQLYTGGQFIYWVKVSVHSFF